MSAAPNPAPHLRVARDPVWDARILGLLSSGWSYGEIAGELDTTRGVVAGVLWRARRKAGGRA